jgi:hypothetical protein
MHGRNDLSLPQLNEAWSALGKATSAAFAGADQARVQIADTTTAALERQVAAATAFAKVKTPQEALELQSKFARETLAAYSANLKTMSDLWTSSLTATMKPIRDLGSKKA